MSQRHELPDSIRCPECDNSLSYQCDGEPTVETVLVTCDVAYTRFLRGEPDNHGSDDELWLPVIDEVIEWIKNAQDTVADEIIDKILNQKETDK